MKDRTVALGIPRQVKKRVADRDSVDGYPCCIYCGRPAPPGNILAFSCAHYIPRAQGGLGVEENILTLCPECHRGFDGPDRNVMRPILERYLRDHYEGWNVETLTYKKSGGKRC